MNILLQEWFSGSILVFMGVKHKSIPSTLQRFCFSDPSWCINGINLDVPSKKNKFNFLFSSPSPWICIPHIWGGCWSITHRIHVLHIYLLIHHKKSYGSQVWNTQSPFTSIPSKYMFYVSFLLLLLIQLAEIRRFRCTWDRFHTPYAPWY